MRPARQAGLPGWIGNASGCSPSASVWFSSPRARVPQGLPHAVLTPRTWQESPAAGARRLAGPSLLLLPPGPLPESEEACLLEAVNFQAFCPHGAVYPCLLTPKSTLRAALGDAILALGVSWLSLPGLTWG